MRERGFGSHGAMGAALLAMVWLAVYLPRIMPMLRMGGWPAGLAIAAGLVGLIGGPLVLIIVDGDEGFGVLGIVAALLAGWGSARLAMVLGASSFRVDLIRLCGASLGPLMLYGGFHLMAKAAQRRR